MKNEITPDSLYVKVAELIQTARKNIVYAVNQTMVYTYYEIGRMIIEDEQHGMERATYGMKVLKELSVKLTEEFGKGFDERELRRMRQFYCLFPIRDALRPELSWTHYRLLLRVDDVVEFSVLAESRQLFASKYQLYMPTKEQLRYLLETERANIETEYSLANEDKKNEPNT